MVSSFIISGCNNSKSKTNKNSTLPFLISDSDNDGLADKYEKQFGLIVGKSDANDSKFDPLMVYQWHLINTQNAPFVATNNLIKGEDINIKPVWRITLGDPNIVVGVVDTGIDIKHNDLVIDRNRSYRYSDKSNDPSPTSSQLLEDHRGASHGTEASGIIGAKGWNTVGVRGIAPLISIAGLNVFSNPTDSSFSDALQKMDIDVSSNSWGGGGASDLYDDSIVLEAIENGIINGRDKLGIIYVFASGNDSANANFQSILTSGYVVAVSSVDGAGEFEEYSDFGANILLCASGGSRSPKSYPAIVTTDITGLEYGMDNYNRQWEIEFNSEGNYTNTMNGTSASCPMVSAVSALILSVSPLLTYRDVFYILAKSARKNDPTNSSWKKNGAGYWISDRYGFGMMDAFKAVSLAEKFTSLGEEYTISKTIKPNKTIQNTKKITIPIEIEDEFFVTLAKATIDIDHKKAGKLKIRLISPEGTVFILAYGDVQLYDTFSPWTLSSVQALDESSKGTWILEVEDMQKEISGLFKSLTLTIKGYKR